MIDEKSAEQVENAITTLAEWGRSFDHQAFEDNYNEYDTSTMVLTHQEVGERMLKKVPEHIKTKMQAHKDRAILQRQVANSLPYILQFPNKDLIEILEKATLMMKMR